MTITLNRTRAALAAVAAALLLVAGACDNNEPGPINRWTAPATSSPAGTACVSCHGIG